MLIEAESAMIAWLNMDELERRVPTESGCTHARIVMQLQPQWFTLYEQWLTTTFLKDLAKHAELPVSCSFALRGDPTQSDSVVEFSPSSPCPLGSNPHLKPPPSTVMPDLAFSPPTVSPAVTAGAKRDRPKRRRLSLPPVNIAPASAVTPSSDVSAVEQPQKKAKGGSSGMKAEKVSSKDLSDSKELRRLKSKYESLVKSNGLLKTKASAMASEIKMLNKQLADAAKSAAPTVVSQSPPPIPDSLLKLIEDLGALVPSIAATSGNLVHAIKESKAVGEKTRKLNDENAQSLSRLLENANECRADILAANERSMHTLANSYRSVMAGVEKNGENFISRLREMDADRERLHKVIVDDLRKQIDSKTAEFNTLNKSIFDRTMALMAQPAVAPHHVPPALQSLISSSQHHLANPWYYAGSFPPSTPSPTPPSASPPPYWAHYQQPPQQGGHQQQHHHNANWQQQQPETQQPPPPPQPHHHHVQQ